MHGPRNFHFGYGHTRFVAIDGASGQAGELGDTRPSDTAGPSVAALRFLDDTPAATSEPQRVVLVHAPPQYLSYREADDRERGALFHAVEITLSEAGAARGRVFQVFAPPGAPAPFTFGD